MVIGGSVGSDVVTGGSVGSDVVTGGSVGSGVVTGGSVGQMWLQVALCVCMYSMYCYVYGYVLCMIRLCVFVVRTRMGHWSAHKVSMAVYHWRICVW